MTKSSKSTPNLASKRVHMKAAGKARPTFRIVYFSSSNLTARQP